MDFRDIFILHDHCGILELIAHDFGLIDSVVDSVEHNVTLDL